MASTIKSSKITVGDAKVPFAKWYNGVFLKQKDNMGMHPLYTRFLKFPPIASSGEFAVVFDQPKVWLKAELTLNEFIALFMIFCNETGGTFKPLVEGAPKGGEVGQYFFEAKGKKSYNDPKQVAGNRPAGDLLVEMKKLDEVKDAAEVKAWNGVVWPKGSSDELKKAALECDFYKYRGRGIVQITARKTYQSSVDPLLGKQKCDDLTDAELTEAVCTNPKVYLPMVKNFFAGKQWQGWLAALNKDPAGFRDVGWHVSGDRDGYGNLYEYRCTTLLDAINKEGYDAA